MVTHKNAEDNRNEYLKMRKDLRSYIRNIKFYCLFAGSIIFQNLLFTFKVRESNLKFSWEDFDIFNAKTEYIRSPDNSVLRYYHAETNGTHFYVFSVPLVLRNITWGRYIRVLYATGNYGIVTHVTGKNGKNLSYLSTSVLWQLKMELKRTILPPKVKKA